MDKKLIEDLEYELICHDARRRASWEEYSGDVAECDFCGKKIRKDQAATWSELTISCQHCDNEMVKEVKAREQVIPILRDLFDSEEYDHHAIKLRFEKIIRMVSDYLALWTPFRGPKIRFEW